MGLCISPHAGMSLHVRESVKEHDLHCKLKSYKVKLFRIIGSLLGHMHKSVSKTLKIFYKLVKICKTINTIG